MNDGIIFFNFFHSPPQMLLNVPSLSLYTFGKGKVKMHIKWHHVNIYVENFLLQIFKVYIVEIVEGLFMVKRHI
jgi:hypothetical protein